jgi:Ala-tRNA(Pro) deacylase
LDSPLVLVIVAAAPSTRIGSIMPATEQDLMARLAALSINCTTHRHPALWTVEESKQLRGDLPGGHCKSLFLKDKKGVFYLVVALEDREIDMKRLRRPIGAAQLSFARPELLMELLGVVPGSVTPFGLINDTDAQVRVVLDREMLAHDPLNYHPLTNEATTAIAPEDLVAFVEACGHEPQFIDFNELETADRIPG